MYNSWQTTITQQERFGSTGKAETMMHGRTDLHLVEVKARQAELASEAREERQARMASQVAGRRPSLRQRIEGAAAGWRQPEKALTA